MSKKSKKYSKKDRKLLMEIVKYLDKDIKEDKRVKRMVTKLLKVS